MRKNGTSSLLSAAACRVTDPFWAGKMELVRGTMLPYQWRVLHRLFLPADAPFREVPGRLSSQIPDLEAAGYRLTQEGWGEELYRDDASDIYEPVILHLVPYHLWNNRGEGEMLVWIHRMANR